MNMIKAFFIMKERSENPNIHELRGRVSGLIKSNNKLKDEVKKTKEKTKLYS